MVDVALSHGGSDNCNANAGVQIAVTSNHSTNSTGDGNTAKDWQIIKSHNVLLRSERAGDASTDRVYAITVTANDSWGSKTSGSVTMTVPHDAGQ